MSSSRKAAAELLDVPALNPLERRLNLQSSSNGPRPSIVPVPKSASYDACNPPDVNPSTPHPVLSRLQNFIPQLEAANQKLSSEMQVRPASDFDVENVPDEQEGGYIEMDLSCGVLDLKDADALRAAEAAMAGHGPDLNVESSSDDTSSCSSGDDEDDRAGDADMAEAVGPGSKESNQASTQTAVKAPGLGQGGQQAAQVLVGNRRRRKAVRVGTGLGAGEGTRKQKPKIVEL